MRSLFPAVIVLGLAATLASPSARGQHRPEDELRATVITERDHYLRNYRVAFADWCAKKRQVCVAELLVRPNGMSVPAPYDQIRLDFVTNLDGKFESSRYEHDKPSKQFAPRTYRTLSGMHIELSPLVWNRVEFTSSTVPAKLELLTEWASKWMDITDTKPVPKGGLLGAVHSVTYPENKFGLWRIEVDFGSADYSAFAELLVALKRMGIERLSIGSTGRPR
jgi:hypothetical protein